MISNNLGLYGAKILAEIGWDLVFFPIWWYSQGLFMFVKKLLEFLQNQQKSLALMVWIKNIFKPMYGQTDWQGMMISIFIRIVQIILRSLIMIFWILVTLIMLIFWVSIPFIVIYQIFYQIIPS